jgi:hypothetical protein
VGATTVVHDQGRLVAARPTPRLLGARLRDRCFDLGGARATKASRSTQWAPSSHPPPRIHVIGAGRGARENASLSAVVFDISAMGPPRTRLPSAGATACGETSADWVMMGGR